MTSYTSRNASWAYILQKLTKRVTEDACSGSDDCIYMCGNSLGLQPKLTSTYVQQQLSNWAAHGVYGHHKRVNGSLTTAFLDVDEDAAAAFAPLVGASKEEVCIMGSLTNNLHILMASFYRPEAKGGRTKIIMEGKAFPSDHVGPYCFNNQL
jgi:kynureninase